jgi:hypothetical protein
MPRSKASSSDGYRSSLRYDVAVSEKPKKRGRPPREPAEGPMVLHLGLRFTARRAAELRRIVDAANQLARDAGIPAVVTPSGLAQMWINERLAEEIAKLARDKR